MLLGVLPMAGTLGRSDGGSRAAAGLAPIAISRACSAANVVLVHGTPIARSSRVLLPLPRGGLLWAAMRAPLRSVLRAVVAPRPSIGHGSALAPRRSTGSSTGLPGRGDPARAGR